MTSDNKYRVWRKSSYSSGQGACVEVAVTRAAIGIRDSKDPDGATLRVSLAEWRAFLRELKRC